MSSWPSWTRYRKATKTTKAIRTIKASLPRPCASRMRQSVIVAGTCVGKLTPLDMTKKNGRKAWRCLCACGNEHVVREDKLLSGHTTSCGCVQAEQNDGRRLKFNARRATSTQEDRDAYRAWLWRTTGTLYDDEDIRDMHCLIRKDLALAGIMDDGMSASSNDYEDEGDGGSTTRWAYGYAV